VIHLYAFASNLRGLPAQAGIAGCPLESLVVDCSTAVVSRAPTADGDVSEEAVVRHGLVVEAVLDRCDGIVPARFGERFADEAALRAAAARLRPSLSERLRRLEGCVEIAVRVVDPRDVDPPSATNGTGYMAAKLGELHERDAIMEALHHPLEYEACASIVATPRAGKLVHEGAYLVRRAGLGRFRARVDRYAGEHPELTVVCTGPWAPYTFADGVEEAA
jgi:hypothetical protein